MTRIHSNNYETTLNGSITNSAISLVATSVTGLPAIGAGVTCNLTLVDGGTIEIVKATAVSTNTITIVRAQEGTSASAFTDGCLISLRVTRDSIDTLAPQASPTFTGTVVLPSGQALIAPALGTPASGVLSNCTGLPVAGGGTGLSTQTAYSVLVGGTTSTGAMQSLASLGTNGQVLTSSGAGALPTWTTVSGGGGGGTFPGSSTDKAVVIFNGTGGSTVQNSVVTITSGAVAGVTTLAASASITVNSQKIGTGLYSDITSFAAGQFTMDHTTGTVASTAIGYQALTALTSGVNNNAHGNQSLKACITGTGNCAFGNGTLQACTNNENAGFGDGALSSVTAGGYMVGIGPSSGSSVATGNYSIFIGFNATSNSTSPTGVIAIGANSIADKASGTTNITDGPGIAIGSSAQLVGFQGDGSIYTTRVGAGGAITTQATCSGYMRVKVNGTYYKLALYPDA